MARFRADFPHHLILNADAWRLIAPKRISSRHGAPLNNSYLGTRQRLNSCADIGHSRINVPRRSHSVRSATVMIYDTTHAASDWPQQRYSSHGGRSLTLIAAHESYLCASRLHNDAFAHHREQSIERLLLGFSLVSLRNYLLSHGRRPASN